MKCGSECASFGSLYRTPRRFLDRLRCRLNTFLWRWPCTCTLPRWRAPPPLALSAPRAPRVSRRVCMVHNRQWGVGYRGGAWRGWRGSRYGNLEGPLACCSQFDSINVHSLRHRLVRSRQYAQKVSSVVLGFLRLKISKHGVSVYCNVEVIGGGGQCGRYTIIARRGCEAGDVWVTVVKTSNVEYF